LLDGSERQVTTEKPVPLPTAPTSPVDLGSAAHVLVVDDNPQNRKLLTDLLSMQGHRTTTAESGAGALAAIAADPPDLVLLDVMMPGMSGYEVCRRLRDDPATSLLPVVMVTALDPAEERVKGIEAGADDFLSKPVNQSELLARVRSLLRVRRLHQTVERQAAELTEWNRTLEERVQAQVAELERLQRLKRFFSPAIAQAIAAEDEALLRPHRRLITVVCVDLRGFTAFAESAEPEEAMQVLREYHEAAGRLVIEFDGTLEQFAGDGILIFFNDPVPVPNHEERALRMAVAVRDAILRLQDVWKRRGFDLDVGLGIASGYATAGVIGFEEKWEYAVIGSVTNQAARLVAAAAPGQVLITERVFAAVEQMIEASPVGELELKGFRRPVTTYDVVGIRNRSDA
jgi:class 3 adenylate cyclase